MLQRAQIEGIGTTIQIETQGLSSASLNPENNSKKSSFQLISSLSNSRKKSHGMDSQEYEKLNQTESKKKP